MRRIRVFVDAPLATGARVELPPFSAEHLTRVLRLSNGAEVWCFNGDGREYKAVLDVRGKGLALLQVGAGADVAAESPLEVTLVQSVARGEKMDSILQKATELGVARIVPIVSERTEVRLDDDRAERRVAHWQRVVESACEQCGRARVPVVEAPVALAAWIATERANGDARLVLHPGAGIALKSLDSATRVTIAVGPEGGFSDRDLDALEIGGFRRVTLGPRILRTETAGPAALAALQALYGDLGT